MPPFNHNILDLTTSTSSPPTNPNSRSNLPLQRRWSTCSYYDTACSTHRTILLAIIIAVCTLTTVVLTLLFVRHHKHRAIGKRATQNQQTNTVRQMRYSYGGWEGADGGAHKAYSTYGCDGHGALSGGGLEVPPPAYTRYSEEVPLVR